MLPHRARTAALRCVDPSIAQLVSRLSDQLDALSAPFPREAVGTGARWARDVVAAVNGIEARQVLEINKWKVSGSGTA